LPTLRERLEDLPRFVAHFLPGVAVEAAVFDVLRAQPWAGNLRELADALGAAATATNGGTVKAEHLPRELRVRAHLEPPAPAAKAIALDPLLEAVEKRLIVLAMRKANGHQTKAAELLGIFRTRLGRRLDALGLQPPATA
jgi:DNA-binding NtrC family response regulator